MILEGIIKVNGIKTMLMEMENASILMVAYMKEVGSMAKDQGREFSLFRDQNMMDHGKTIWQMEKEF